MVDNGWYLTVAHNGYKQWSIIINTTVVNCGQLCLKQCFVVDFDQQLTTWSINNAVNHAVPPWFDRWLTVLGTAWSSCRQRVACEVLQVVAGAHVVQQPNQSQFSVVLPQQGMELEAWWLMADEFTSSGWWRSGGFLLRRVTWLMIDGCLWLFEGQLMVKWGSFDGYLMATWGSTDGWVRVNPR